MRIDERLVATARADSWGFVDPPNVATPKRRFALALPDAFADGIVRQARFFDDRGRELAGSPLLFFAHAERLVAVPRDGPEERRLLAFLEQERYSLGLPFKQFRAQKSEVNEERAAAGLQRIAVALVGGGDADDTLESLEGRDGVDCVACLPSKGEGQTAFVAEALARFLAEDAATCDLVIFALAGTRFEPDAVAKFAAAWKTFPDATIAYSDLVLTAPDGGEWPIAYGAFDKERWLEQGAGAYLFALSRAAAKAATVQGAEDLFELFAAALETKAASPPVHVPGFLAALPPLDLVDASRRIASVARAHLDRSRQPGRVVAAP